MLFPLPPHRGRIPGQLYERGSSDHSFSWCPLDTDPARSDHRYLHLQQGQEEKKVEEADPSFKVGYFFSVALQKAYTNPKLVPRLPSFFTTTKAGKPGDY